MDETIEIKVTSEMAGKRLDVVLSEQCSDLTRSYINKLCKEERAALNGKTSKGNKKCKDTIIYEKINFLMDSTGSSQSASFG